jgi:hypothetical protein
LRLFPSISCEQIGGIRNRPLGHRHALLAELSLAELKVLFAQTPDASK